MASLLERHPYYQLNWMAMSLEERRNRLALADDWARTTLKPGDILVVAGCGGRSWVRMTGWDGNWIMSRYRYDIAPLDVLRVNGRDVDQPAHRMPLD